MSYYYQIHHVTRFDYDSPIRESVMEVRVRPLDENHQQCVSYELTVSPRAQIMVYRDFLGNHVNHFDIPGTHLHETITAEATVRIDPINEPPATLPASSWDQLEQLKNDPFVWEMTQPSGFARPTAALDAFSSEVGLKRLGDPMSTVRWLSTLMRDGFEYKPQTTRVDSPIDEALESRAGVCQDFAHIMIALCRGLGIPARYVSGYLYHREDNGHRDRSAVDATHAWVEVMLPGLGWVGFDPTNDVVTTDRHIRAAVGRDYADVPPTRGVYRGHAEGTISVAVEVTQLTEAPRQLTRAFEVTGWIPPDPVEDVLPLEDDPKPFEYFAQQMQQQQE